MEAFEQISKLFLEGKGFAVSENIKFPVKVLTKKLSRPERQTNGYEIDLVAARRDQLLLCSVKSFFGSEGVGANWFRGIAKMPQATLLSRCKLFNDEQVRVGIVNAAMERYGYVKEDIRLVLFVGKFKRREEAAVRNHLLTYDFGAKVDVYSVDDMVDPLVAEGRRGMYRNNPVIMTLRMLTQTGHLK